MANGERKPGEALADGIRERHERNRKRFKEAAESLFDDWEEPTSPEIRIVRTDGTTQSASDAPPSLTQLPFIGRVVAAFPRPWRPFAALVLIASLGLGALEWPWFRGLVGLPTVTEETERPKRRWHRERPEPERLQEPPGRDD